MKAVWITALISTLLLINEWLTEYMECKINPYGRDMKSETRRILYQSLKKLFFMVLSSIMWTLIILE